MLIIDFVSASYKKNPPPKKKFFWQKNDKKRKESTFFLINKIFKKNYLKILVLQGGMSTKKSPE